MQNLFFLLGFLLVGIGVSEFGHWHRATSLGHAIVSLIAHGLPMVSVVWLSFSVAGKKTSMVTELRVLRAIVVATGLSWALVLHPEWRLRAAENSADSARQTLIELEADGYQGERSRSFRAYVAEQQALYRAAEAASQRHVTWFDRSARSLLALVLTLFVLMGTHVFAAEARERAERHRPTE